MHCFVDFKARENEICLANESSEADIPVVIKDANINCTGTNEIHTKQSVPEPGRRKLSAEKILSAIQRKANTITSSLRMTSRHGILGHLGVECTSGGTTIPLNLIETEQELKGSLK